MFSFKFHSSTQFSADSPGFVSIPSLKDKIHIVVIVMDATSIDIFPPAIVEKLKVLQAKVNQRGINNIKLTFLEVYKMYIVILRIYLFYF